MEVAVVSLCRSDQEQGWTCNPERNMLRHGSTCMHTDTGAGTQTYGSGTETSAPLPRYKVKSHRKYLGTGCNKKTGWMAVMRPRGQPGEHVDLCLPTHHQPLSSLLSPFTHALSSSHWLSSLPFSTLVSCSMPLIITLSHSISVLVHWNLVFVILLSRTSWPDMVSLVQLPRSCWPCENVLLKGSQCSPQIVCEAWLWLPYIAPLRHLWYLGILHGALCNSCDLLSVTYCAQQFFMSAAVVSHGLLS